MLDVRTGEEHAEWAIPGNVHVDAYETLKANDPDALRGVELPENGPVVTACEAGKTSMVAAEQLRSRGGEGRNTAEVPVPGGEVGIVRVRHTGKGCLSCVVYGADLRWKKCARTLYCCEKRSRASFRRPPAASRPRRRITRAS